MIRRFAFVVLAFGVLGAEGVHAQIAPRDLWPQATSAARDGDFDAATKTTNELLDLGAKSGIKTFPLYATSASGLASESAKQHRELSDWAANAAGRLDGRSPAVAFSNADRAAAGNEWGKAIRFALSGYGRVFGDYRTRVLGRSDVILMAILAIFFTAIIFSIAMLIRYGRSIGHDLRETLGNRLRGGSVSVLAFALLFLPVFLWLGPMWLVFYWLAISFGYAMPVERIAIVLLLLLVAFLPIAADMTSNRIAGVDSPVLMAAISSANRSYQPDALRRIQELIAVVPDNAMLHVLAGNLLVFENSDAQAAQHYRRAAELRRSYAGAHVNLGNLHFLNNEYQTAITEYERAQRADPDLAIAYFNHSVAAGETYKFDQQAQMLEKARKADASFIDRIGTPTQKIVMYHPSIDEAWDVQRSIMITRPAARALFGNYSAFDPAKSVTSPVTIGSLFALLLALVLWAKRRKGGYANACIKCGRTFCHLCKSARESATYCTQCIHIYLKRDGVSLDTKRQKLDEVTSHQTGMLRRNRIFAILLPGSAQMLEGRIVAGTIGIFLFALFVAIAFFVGRLAPALGPVAEVAQMLVRIAAIVLAVVIWLMLLLPAVRRRFAA